MRKLLTLLLGSATVVGFETTFGLSNWKPFSPTPRFKLKETLVSIMPGGITYVSNLSMSAIRNQQKLI